MEASGSVSPGARRLWQDEVRRVYERIKAHQSPYPVIVNGIELSVLPNVFSPLYFTNSGWFAENLPELVGNGRFLEIGSGTGIVALVSALGGAKVTATDINPDAVLNTRLNLERYGISATVYEGDLFIPIPHTEVFDVIFWNHPFNKGERPEDDILLRAGFDYEYRSLEGYFKMARNYLAPGGKLLLGTGNFADLPSVLELAERYGYAPELLRTAEFPISPESLFLNDYRIYHMVDTGRMSQ